MTALNLMPANLIQGVFVLTAIVFFCALFLLLAQRKYRPKTDDLIDKINALLPQTQCAQCGYPGCKPYANAIATGEAINRCPPGGDKTIAALAQLLRRDQEPLNTALGITKAKQVALIREADCIGCTLCIRACPVDAIMGAKGFMHTVIADYCTGCELCIAPCPVDCIELKSSCTP